MINKQPLVSSGLPERHQPLEGGDGVPGDGGQPHVHLVKQRRVGRRVVRQLDNDAPVIPGGHSQMTSQSTLTQIYCKWFFSLCC